MKQTFFTICLFIISISSLSQTHIQLTHYTADDGLSDNNVVSMLQDKRGYMWFSTCDGLNKYDGYTFKTYKTNPDKKFSLVNYRIDYMKEEDEGYIWVQSYDGRIYRFDPSKEIFLPVPQCIKKHESFNRPLKILKILNDGTVWLKGATNNNLFRITRANGYNQLQITDFSDHFKDNPANNINKIYLDKKKNTWILSSKKVSLLRNKSRTITDLDNSKNSTGTSSIREVYPNMYIGGEKGILRVYNSKTNTIQSIQTPCNSDIISIYSINKNELFILTNKSGFCLYNLISHQFTAFNKANTRGLNSNNFRTSCIDKQKNIWLDTDNSNVVYFETAQRGIFNFSMPTDKLVQNTSDRAFFILEDKNNNIWVHPVGGGFMIYNRKENRLDPFYPDPNAKDDMYSNITKAIMDKQGNFWLKSTNEGIFKVVFRQSPFMLYKIERGNNYSEQNQVRSVYQDNNNWLWVGTKKGLLYLFDDKKNMTGYMGADGNLNGKTPLKALVYNIINDHSGKIWLASKGNGLYCLEKSGQTHSYKITNYRHNTNDKYSLSSDDVVSVFEDHNKRLWIATYGGGINLLENKNGRIRFINYQNQLKSYPMRVCLKSRFITEDNRNHICVGTTEGMIVFKPEYQAPGKTHFYHFVHNPNDNQSLSSNDVSYILSAKNGNLYIATFGGGVNIVEKGIDPDKKNIFRSYSKSNGSFSDIVCSVLEDAKSNIWLTTQTKIAKYNTTTKSFDIYNPATSGSYTFLEAAVCKTSQSDLVFGTRQGFIEFNPEKVIKSNFVPRISFTQLQIFNKTMEVGAKDSPLTQQVDYMRKIKLNHNQNMISINYAALDYASPQDIQYAYKLDGVDSDWNYVGNQRIATYDNLPKGNYVFRVKSTNADGVWVNNEKSILIHKLPSFWESIWGILFYIVLFLIVSGLVSYILFIFYKLKHEIKVEHRITNLKLRFFTDISHELRTPLTLVAIPVENILRTEILHERVKEQLMIVHRNTDRMLRLVNQILDFRKVQSKKMKLVIEDVATAQYVQEICLNFCSLAKERNIDFTVLDNSNEAHLWVDKDKFEKILFNLLSNAFKYTLPNNSIKVIIEEEQESVIIKITDKGTGIRKDMLKHLFNRFETLVASDQTYQASTGIGLSLTKELVELHKARIDVESELGKGTSFILTFMKGYQHFDNSDEYVLQDLTSQVSNDELPLATPCENNSSEQDIHSLHELSTILVVEDNAELRHLLFSILKTNYRVLEASNGKEAVDLLHDCDPDIIISDIMMPVMDGLELVKTIKEDINLSHIPIILLTAKEGIDSKLQAMECCVDDYIVKPFSSAYLEARIENILKSRKQLQEYYKTLFSNRSISITKPQISPLDDDFIKNIIHYVESNIDDSELSIERIAIHLGLSRSSLFKKIKSMTGLAPVDLIKNIRLGRAIQLIESANYNVSQVAYMVGFDDPKYFSKCFKIKYGIAPSEFKHYQINSSEYNSCK
jgi:Signal transduction histidine kinase